ncbi:MAG: MtnX-like HAD-IB family phosphatase [Solirubrobacterales bacterium]
MRRIFFLDFDGTITMHDTCGVIVTTFCEPGWEAVNERWERGEIGTVDCARETFALMDTTPEAILTCVSRIPADPGFQRLIAQIRQRGDRVVIVSDGYRQIIDAILERESAADLERYSNELVLVDGRFDIGTPHFNDDCGVCGTCKTSIVRRCSEPGVERIYIGDGLSDKCPVNEADRVFAKGKLLDYCRGKGIPCQAYGTLHDVAEALDWEPR